MSALTVDDERVLEAELPTGFWEDYPGVSRSPTGEYTADSLTLCRVLAQSSRWRNALNNSESYTAAFVLGWLAVADPQWDTTGPTVKRREFIPSWVKKHWDEIYPRCLSPFDDNEELKDMLHSDCDSDEEPEDDNVASSNSDDESDSGMVIEVSDLSEVDSDESCGEYSTVSKGEMEECEE
jgi:hypothetical protein